MVLLRKLNNADAGTVSTLGGNDTDKVADYFNDIDTGEVPRINTPTEYRSGILKVRDGSNTYNVALKSATQTADREFTIPALIGNDVPATLGLANVYTNLQQITYDADTLINLYRPSSSTNSLNSIAFYHRNSSNASTKYASIASQVITNTTSLEDGKLKFFVKKAGVDTEVMSIDKDGVVTAATFSGGVGGGAGLSANEFTGIQTINVNNALPLVLYRPANTNTNLAGIDFQQNNSTPVAKTYARYQSKIVSNTAGQENGAVEEYVMKAGTVTKVRTLDANGVMMIGPSANVAVGGLVYNSGAALDTASSNSEFTMITYSVPANLLGTNGLLRCIITGYLFQNNATATDFTIRVKFGGTTIYDGATNIVQGSANLPFILEVWLGNNNATNAQSCNGRLILNDTGTTGLTTGEGCLENDEISVNAPFRAADGASTKDTTSAQTFLISMQMSVFNSNVKTNIRRRTIEFIPGV